MILLCYTEDNHNNNKNHLAVELTQELGRRITAVTDDPRETGFLFQRLSVSK